MATPLYSAVHIYNHLSRPLSTRSFSFITRINTYWDRCAGSLSAAGLFVIGLAYLSFSLVPLRALNENEIHRARNGKIFVFAHLYIMALYYSSIGRIWFRRLKTNTEYDWYAFVWRAVAVRRTKDENIYIKKRALKDHTFPHEWTRTERHGR